MISKYNRRNCKFKIVGLFLCICLLFGGCSGNRSLLRGNGRGQQEYSATGLAMGTVFQARVWMPPTQEDSIGKNTKEENEKDDAPGDSVKDFIKEDVAKGILDIAEATEEKISWRLEASEVARVNQRLEAGESTEWIPISDELELILQAYLELGEKCDGVIDVTIGPVTALWEIDKWTGEEGFVLPENEKIQRALQKVGQSELRIEDHRLFLPENRSLDLGAAGKGIVLDQCKDYLERQQVSCGIVNAGGSVLTFQTKESGEAWNVGIIDPEKPETMKYTLKVPGTCFISTSGDYERYVEVDGKRYHHIMDPRTGYPADSDLRSVTIIIEDGVLEQPGLMSDLLSTACFILGKEKGMELVKSYGVEAIFIDKNGETSYTEKAGTMLKK